MATLVGVKEFTPGKSASWEEYSERLAFYLEANRITDTIRKRAVLLSACGASTYSVVRSLVSPALPCEKTYEELVDLLNAYFCPKPSEINCDAWQSIAILEQDSNECSVIALYAECATNIYSVVYWQSRVLLLRWLRRWQLHRRAPRSVSENYVVLTPLQRLSSRIVSSEMSIAVSVERKDTSYVLVVQRHNKSRTRSHVNGMQLAMVKWFEPAKTSARLERAAAQQKAFTIFRIHQVNRSSVKEVIDELKDIFSEANMYKGQESSVCDAPGNRVRTVKLLVDQGVLEPIEHTIWATPIVRVRKVDGGMRICGDYKCTLNKALCPNQYPVPSAEQLFSTLARGRRFAKIDLAQAYQQLEVDAASAEAQAEA
uniref:Reverse transcriptase domain-containing protein n=1 Tax=Trichuris muris TaxID=70415 RepID=A0A5S6QGV0_TRIMR